MWEAEMALRREELERWRIMIEKSDERFEKLIERLDKRETK
jgi:hypothetical protein